MSYQRVCDILSRVHTFHEELRAYYEGLAADSRDERFELLLQEMKGQENNFARCLERYTPEATQGILETWLQFVPDDSVRAALAENDLEPDMSPNEVVRRALEVNRELKELHRQLADQTSAPRVQELFRDLLVLEDGKDARVSWSMSEFERE